MAWEFWAAPVEGAQYDVDHWKTPYPHSCQSVLDAVNLVASLSQLVAVQEEGVITLSNYELSVACYFHDDGVVFYDFHVHLLWSKELVSINH